MKGNPINYDQTTFAKLIEESAFTVRNSYGEPKPDLPVDPVVLVSDLETWANDHFIEFPDDFRELELLVFNFWQYPEEKEHFNLLIHLLRMILLQRNHNPENKMETTKQVLKDIIDRL